MNAIADPDCGSVVLMMCSQLVGKTSIIETDLGWMIHQKPAPTVCVFPTQDNANAWSKNRFGPLIESTGVLTQLVDAPNTRAGTRSGYGENTICHKRFHGGWVLANGSNSGANLRAHTAKICVFDEVDGYISDIEGEGDPLILVEQRSARFSDAFSIKTSTPTVKHFSRIEKEFEGTDKRYWHITCLNPKCRHEYVIGWGDIRWPKFVGPDNTTIHSIHEAYLQCPSCKEHFTDKQRMAMVEKGKWIATNPSVRGKRGYAANAFIVLGPHKRGFESWLHYFAQRFMDASALGDTGLRTFQNLICGEPYEVETTKPPDSEMLFNRREEYLEDSEGIILPEKVLFLTCGVDCQLDRLEAEIVGWALNEETFGVAYKIFRGNIEALDVWHQLDQWIQQTWRHPSGHRLHPTVACVDSSNKPAPVYEFSKRCAPRPVYAIKGERGFQSNWVSRSGGRFQRLFILKVDTFKEAFYSRLRNESGAGAGFQHFPSNVSSGYDSTYFAQLCSETMRSSFVRGRFAPYFEKIHSGARNEALDCRVYAGAAKEITNPDYAKYQQDLARPPLNDWRPKVPEPPKPPPEPVTQVPVTPPPPKAGFRPRRTSGWAKAY